MKQTAKWVQCEPSHGFICSEGIVVWVFPEMVDMQTSRLSQRMINHVQTPNISTINSNGFVRQGFRKQRICVYDGWFAKRINQGLEATQSESPLRFSDSYSFGHGSMLPMRFQSLESFAQSCSKGVGCVGCVVGISTLLVIRNIGW